MPAQWLLLICALCLATAACAEAPQTGASATAAATATGLPVLPAGSAAAPTRAADTPTPAVAASATPPPTAAPAVVASATLSGTQASSSALSPVQALAQSLALADQEMKAAQASPSLEEAQRHAQAVINITVGAWGRWYDVSRVDDPSDRRGVFPGERIPGPANDTSTDVSPIGWGIRAFDSGDVRTQAAVQMVMGDVTLWRNAPRSQYDAIQRVVTQADASHPSVSTLPGRGMRAVAWARLILVKAVSVEQAQQFAALGSQETGAALAAVQGLQ